MLAAHRDFEAFRGESPEQFTAWLRAILSRNLFRAIERHIKTDKRDLRREVSLDQVAGSVDSSAAGLAKLLASDQSTASQIVSRDEQTRRLIDLLEQLPEHYQQVIMLRNFQGLRFDDVARHMGRTATATRLLWLRAIKKLREAFDAESSEQ
ncbi:MAG: sigma-70 family RNA polymerase sigma factor [Pirellulaceae bacterium]